MTLCLNIDHLHRKLLLRINLKNSLPYETYSENLFHIAFDTKELFMSNGVPTVICSMKSMPPLKVLAFSVCFLQGIVLTATDIPPCFNET